MPVAGALLCAIIVLALPVHSPAAAQLDEEEVSHPSRIPLLDDFHTPQIEPGKDGKLTFDLTNRYNYNITRLTLELEIYKFADLDTSEALEHLDEVPTFRSSDAEGAIAEANRSGVTFHFASGLLSKAKVGCTVKVHASIYSKVGTYLVRTSIEFDMEGNTFRMASRGYFHDDDWYDYEEHRNLTRLGLDSGLGGLHGIVPDTSFGVKKSTDYTYFYMLVALIVVFGVLALFFYLMDERDMFPGAREKLDRGWDRVRGRDGSS
jgi:hypothetical protein